MFRYFSYGSLVQDSQLQVPCLTHNGAEKRSSLPHHLFIKKPKISANAVFACFMGTYSGVMTLYGQFLLKKKLHPFKEKVAPQLYICVLFWCVSSHDHGKTASASSVRIGLRVQAVR